MFSGKLPRLKGDAHRETDHWDDHLSVRDKVVTKSCHAVMSRRVVKHGGLMLLHGPVLRLSDNVMLILSYYAVI